MITLKLSKRQWIGFGCIYLAGLGWLADIIIPFTHLSSKPIWFFAAAAFAELMFFTGVWMVGKPYYRQVKAALLRQLTRRNRD